MLAAKTSENNAPQTIGITACRCPQLRSRHARLFAEKNSIKKDGIAAGTLHMLKQHYNGKLRITDVREMFIAMKYQA